MSAAVKPIVSSSLNSQVLFKPRTPRSPTNTLLKLINPSPGHVLFQANKVGFCSHGVLSFVCFTCLICRRRAASCGLCLCICRLVWTHAEPSSSSPGYQRSEKIVPYAPHILLLLSLGLKGARCEETHACVLHTEVFVCF